MKVHTLNIMMTDPEMLYVTKHSMESERIKRDPTYQRKTLTGFIEDCHIIYVYVNEKYDSIPFGIKQETSDDLWVFYASDDEKMVSELMDVLSTINYEIPRLYEVPLESLYTGKLEGKKHFILNNKNYSLEKL